MYLQIDPSEVPDDTTEFATLAAVTASKLSGVRLDEDGGFEGDCDSDPGPRAVVDLFDFVYDMHRRAATEREASIVPFLRRVADEVERRTAKPVR